MSVLAGVFASLKTMSLLQLLLAFVACTTYVLAQGGLFGRVGRRWAWTLAFCAAAGFVVMMSREWPNAVMLVAIAVAGLGSFTAMVWLTSRLIGVDRAAPALEGAAMTGAEPAPASGETGRRAIGATAIST